MTFNVSDKYIELPGIINNGKILAEKYPDKFSDLPFDGIKCFGKLESKDNKNNKSKQIWTVSFLPSPLIDLMQIHAIVFIDFDSYSALNDSQVSLLCADIFMSFAFDKALFLKPFDIKDHYDMLNNFGFNYLENVESPNVLEDHWNWR